MKSLKSILIGLSFCLISVNAMATKDYTSIKVSNTVAWISSRLTDMAVEMCAGQEGGFESECFKQSNGPVYQLQDYESMRLGYKLPAYSLEVDLLPGQVKRDVLAQIEIYNSFKTIKDGSLKRSNKVREVFINYMNGNLLTDSQHKKLRRNF
jgi:hypothetical protein